MKLANQKVIVRGGEGVNALYWMYVYLASKVQLLVAALSHCLVVPARAANGRI